MLITYLLGFVGTKGMYYVAVTYIVINMFLYSLLTTINFGSLNHQHVHLKFVQVACAIFLQWI